MRTAVAAGVGTMPTMYETVYGVSGPVSSNRWSPVHEPAVDLVPAPVLIVDDEPGIVEFLCFALEEHGYRVAAARDGSAALDEIARERPACVVTDLMMPRLNGWDFARQLRRNAATASIPIVAMSAVDPTGAPADAYLRKPFELQDLLSILDGLGVSSEPDEGAGSHHG